MIGAVWGSPESSSTNASWGKENAFAVFSVVLLVLSAMTAPVAASAGVDVGNETATPTASEAGASTQQATANDTEASVATPIRGPQLTFAMARDEAAAIETNRSDRRSHVDRATREFEGAVAAFDSPTDASLDSLLGAAQGTRALRAVVVSGNSDLTDEQRASIQRSSRLALQATNATARLQLEKAKSRLAARESDISNGQYQSLEASIENAERAYERAERVRDRIDADNRLARTLNQRAQAITKYRVGWQQATQVLDRLDAPANRSDADGDGVHDAREQRIGTNVTRADSDGDGIDDGVETGGGVPLDADGDGTLDALDTDSDGDSLPDSMEGTDDTDGDAIANFRDADDDGDGISTKAEIEDSIAPDGDRDFDDVPNWFDTDADGDGEPDATEGRVDHDGDGDPAYLDADLDEDGLPDAYERNVTGTDPENNDSDASATSVDEGNDGVIDGLEDFDNDTLSNFREYSIGTDPYAADTDGDGLSDAFEVRRSAFEPLRPDTNDDGTSDGAEDHDADGLNNSRESELGTAFARNDTDGDEIGDGKETELGIDPTSSDTDEDGLPDEDELSLPTDPTNPDSDEDGVLDGNETFTTRVENTSLGVSVSLTGSGDVADDVSVENGTTERLSTPTIQNARAGPFVNLESEREFDSANVTISYNAAAVAENTTLAVARYNRTTQTFDLLDSHTDRSNGTVTAKTSHFSRFTVFKVRNWEGSFTAEDPQENVSSGEGEVVPVDVALLFDTSGSMNNNDPNELSKVAAKQFVGSLLPRDRAAVIEFAYQGHVNQSFTSDFAAVNRTIEELRYRGGRGGTNFSSIDRVNDHFASHGKPDRAKVMIFLTDGRSVHGDGIAEAREAARNNITIHAIGFGGASESALKPIAEPTGGSVYFVDDASELPDIFSRVADNTSSGAVDSDGDGLPDHVERGFSTGIAGEISTQPDDPDTDNDGLQDGEEVDKRVEGYTQKVVLDGVRKSVEYDYWRLHSNPTVHDTDGDDLNDSTETNGWEIQVAQDRTTAKEFVEASRGNDPNAADILDPQPVSSSPLLTDSDDDDLTDGFENARGLDPGSADTDTDTIRDSRELDEQWYPTLHDYRPPRMFGSVDTDGNRVNYQVNITANDQTGVGEVTVYKRGEERMTWDAEGAPDVPHHSLKFELDRNLADQALTGASGWIHASSARVVVSDVHGNTVESTVNGPDNLGKVGGAFARAGWLPDRVQSLGVVAFSGLSGLTQGINSLKNDAISAGYTLAQPSKYPDAVQKTVTGIRQTAVIAASSEKRNKAFSALIQKFGEQRRQLNPLEDNEYRDQFAIGYTVGYSTSYIIPVAGEAKALQFAGRVRYLGAAVRAADRVNSAIKGALMGSAMWTGTRIARLAPDGIKADLGKVTAEIDSDLNLKPKNVDIGMSDRARLTIARTADELKDTSLPVQRQLGDILSTDRGEEVGKWLTRSIEADDGARLQRGLAYLRRTGADGRDVLAGLGTDARKQLLRLDSSMQRRVTTAADSLRTERVESFLDWQASLRSGAKSRVDDLVQRYGPDSVRFFSRLDADNRRNVVDDLEKTTDGGRVVDDLIRESDEIDDINRYLDDNINDLTGDARVRATKLIDETDDGIHLIDDLDDGARKALLEGDELTDAEVVRLGKRFDELSNSNKNRFVSIIKDGDIRKSWIKVASRQNVNSQEVKYALGSVDQIKDYGTVQKFYTGKNVQNFEYPSGWDKVYPENSIVTEYEIDQGTRFYRLYTKGENRPAGRFLLQSEDNIRSHSPQELQGKYAIPNNPPNAVAVGEIPKDTTMRTGRVAKNDFGNGGGRQFTIPKSEVPDLNEDWFEKAPDLTKELDN